ncbi:CaiB/BaiF CoA transferase family protein [Candidatus Poriferisocius sp.]|uniref:CaiB/BaiF CoA transferase family protein n=1 Tax=Candidatus Poriferisocius sp. TaxID=3101276 RepID=UPI003B013396
MAGAAARGVPTPGRAAGGLLGTPGGAVLDRVRVLELTGTIAGAYTAKLFADAGAEVVKVEPPGGDRWRSWSASGSSEHGDGAFFRFLNAGKRSVVIDLDEPGGRDRFLDMARTTDVVVEDRGAGVVESLGLGHGELTRRNPALVMLSISPWGRGGPWDQRPANEFTLQAWVGSTDGRGIPGEMPFGVGGKLGEFLVAANAAALGLGALMAARRDGTAGEHVDVSAYEAMTTSFVVYAHLYAAYAPESRTGERSIEIPSVEPARDGWVGFCTITGQQFKDFCVVIDDPAMADDPALATASGRLDNRNEVWERIARYTRAHTVDEIVEKAILLRVPVAPIGDGSRVARIDHFAERGVYVQNPGGFIQPRVPYTLGRRPRLPVRPAPAPGEGTEELLAGSAHFESGAAGGLPRTESREAAGGLPRTESREAAGGLPRTESREAAGGLPRTESPEVAGGLPRTEPSQPLAGLRVCDLATFWAGPVASCLLSALGADVIKVESIQRPDGMRFASGLQRDDLWEWSPVCHGANTGKRSVTLDLSSDDGLALVKRLVGMSDIVIENYSPRVVENFGLGWDEVHRLNPDAIMVRMPAFGLDGPWRDRTGFAMTIEQASGLAFLTGDPDGPPLVPRGICDQLGGMHAVFATLLALEHRAQTGEGQLVEVPLIEAGLNAAAEQVIEWTAYGQLLQRGGNRSPYAAPQGIYAAAGEDRWVVISVDDDAQWPALAELLGRSDWAGWADRADRQAHHDEIDAAINHWVAHRDRDAAVAELLDAGVPAAPVITGRESMDNPQLAARGHHQWMDHPVVGRVPYPSFPARFNGSYHSLGRPAPTLGQHNEEILRDVLGLDDTEITRLAEAQVIGTRPANWG